MRGLFEMPELLIKKQERYHHMSYTMLVVAGYVNICICHSSPLQQFYCSIVRHAKLPRFGFTGRCYINSNEKLSLLDRFENSVRSLKTIRRELTTFRCHIYCLFSLGGCTYSAIWECFIV